MKNHELNFFYDDELKQTALNSDEMTEFVNDELAQTEKMDLHSFTNHQLNSFVSRLGSIGGYLKILRRYEEADKIFQKASFLIESRSLPEKTKLVNQLRWADNYRYAGHFEVSEEMFNEALLKTQQDIHLSSYEDFALQHLGKLFFDLKKNVIALKYFNSALQIRYKKNDSELIESTKQAIEATKRKINRICIVGNSCSGKTTLAHALRNEFPLEIFHVDSIQYLPGLIWRDPEETRALLSEIAEKQEWIIDGLGPLKILEARMQKSDLIIALRPPLKKIYWQFIKRQCVGLFKRRPELPENCFEATPAQTFRMVRTIWNVNRGLWAQLDRIFQRDLYKDKLIQVFHEQDLEKLIISYAKKN